MTRVWLFTVFGFFSVVVARQGNGAPGAPLDPERVMIRARHPDHLHRLKKRFPKELGTAQVMITERADYLARIIVPRDVWASIVAELTEELDYGNFKSAAGKSGASASDLSLLHQVWGVASSWQGRTRYEPGSSDVLRDENGGLPFGGSRSDN